MAIAAVTLPASHSTEGMDQQMPSRKDKSKVAPTWNKKLKDAVEAKIKRDAITRYKVAADSGISYNVLARWLDDDTATLSLVSAETIAVYVGMRLYPEDECCKSHRR